MVKLQFGENMVKVQFGVQELESSMDRGEDESGVWMGFKRGLALFCSYEEAR